MSATATADRITALQRVFDGLMRRYQERVPAMRTIVDAMVAEGLIAGPGPARIESDHIALRTMGVPQLGIASIERVFLHYGYERRGYYDFPAKRLSAFWYAPPSPALPRIFISELRVADLSADAQVIIRSYTDEVTADPVDQLNLDDAAQVDGFLHRELWRLPALADYRRLAQESEYAAWVIANRSYLNHFTIAIQNLPDGYNTIAGFNAFLERNGVLIGDPDRKITPSPDGALSKSSIIAEMIDVTFADAVAERIPGAYVEFAERRPVAAFAHLPAAQPHRSHRREGGEGAYSRQPAPHGQ